MDRGLRDRNGEHYVGCYERKACREQGGRGGRGEERGNNTEKTTREDVCQKCCVSAVHSSPTPRVRESESGKYRVPIKKGREEKEKEGRGGKPTLAPSLGPSRRNDQALSFTSAADGHKGPLTLIFLLFCYNSLHFSLHLSSVLLPPSPPHSPQHWLLL